MPDLFTPKPADVAAQTRTDARASGDEARRDLHHIGRELRRLRLHLCANATGLALRRAPHSDGRVSREDADVPETLTRLIRLHARRLRRLALLVPPDELTRLLCSLFAPLPRRFELHQGTTVTDPEKWRAAMIRDVEQGPHGPRYRTGALGRDLEALERVTSAHALRLAA